ncbi:hypothetical protein [Helicobacter sp. 11S02629-2]|uniref:hypothetical protein n=1 Tax=Helicobacter sp. 11S02629-2 TaxID=1476195 RepID=UPI000BA5EB60|nr:hypothetical protein [Helicobacter sp. 11S02629-2]PAF43252.1 hypothetical protein BKH40_07045 [Helicobacter sp. 11S02629-2]
MKFFKAILLSLSLSSVLFAGVDGTSPMGMNPTNSMDMNTSNMNTGAVTQDSAQASAIKELKALADTMGSFVNSMPPYIAPSLNHELSIFLASVGLKQSDLKCELKGNKATCNIGDDVKKKNFIQDFKAEENINKTQIDSNLHLTLDKRSDFYASLRDSLKPLIPNKLECKNVNKIENLEYKANSNCNFSAPNATYKMEVSGYKHDEAYKHAKVFDKAKSEALKMPSDSRIDKVDLILDMGIIKTTILEFMNSGNNSGQKVDFNSAVAGLQTISMMMIPQLVTDPNAIAFMNDLANQFFLALRSNKKNIEIKIVEKPSMHNVSVDMVQKPANELTNEDLNKGLKIFASQYDFKITSF